MASYKVTKTTTTTAKKSSQPLGGYNFGQVSHSFTIANPTFGLSHSFTIQGYDPYALSGKVDPAYYGRYMTLQDNIVNQYILRDARTLDKIEAAIRSLDENVAAFIRSAENAYNRNLARGLPVNEQIYRMKLVIQGANERRAQLVSKAKAIKNKTYKCGLTQHLYQSY